MDPINQVVSAEAMATEDGYKVTVDPTKIMGIDSLISNTVRDVKEVDVQIKLKSKELKERLGLNPTYESVNDEYKGVAKTRKDVKVQVIAKDEVMKKLDEELKALKNQKKELDNLLSDKLIEFSESTGQMSFLDDDGNVVEFEKVAKIRIKTA